MNIESQLKDLLRRREPPAGFAERVMAKVEDRQSCLSVEDRQSCLSGQARQARLPVFHSRAWRALAAAALIVALLGAWGVHATLRARDELRLAMRITAEKVAGAQQQVRAVSR